MSDISSRRRKLGIAALATTALAIPLTATVSYALPEAAQDAPDPLAPPPPPEAPVPPEAPAAPEAPGAVHKVITIELDGDEEGGPHRIERRIVMRDGEFDEAEFEAEMERLEAELEKLEDVDHRQIEHEVRIAHAEVARARAEAGEAREHARQAAREARAMAFSVDGTECEESGETVIERDLGDGRRAMIVCQKHVMRSALSGIEAAREAIAADKNLSAEQREEILRGLDEAIAEMEAHKSAALEVNRTTAPVSRVTQWQPVPVRMLRAVAVPAAPSVPALPASSVADDCPDAPSAPAAPRTQLTA